MKNIEAIISDLERQRQGIDEAIAALRAVEGGRPATKRRGRPPGTKNAPLAVKKRGGKRNMSPEGKARIAEAARTDC